MLTIKAHHAERRVFLRARPVSPGLVGALDK
jgi:hypothetical protein